MPPTAWCRRRPSWVWSRPDSAPNAAAAWWFRSGPTAGGRNVRGTGGWTRPIWSRDDDRGADRRRAADFATAGGHHGGGGAHRGGGGPPAGRRARRRAVGVAGPADQGGGGADPQRGAAARIPGQRSRSFLRLRI